jgi:2-polyprenyl-3-methyl-5-hydroxy-6-metoxy-1,4-benzoquinol methylase
MNAVDHDRLDEAEHALSDRLRRYGTWFQRRQLAYKTSVIRQSGILSYVSRKGTIVDVGCGTGLLACLLALALPGKRVVGIDSNRGRIASCSRLARDIPNVTFLHGDVRDHAFLPVEEAICLDVLHHLSFADQDALVFRIAESLRRGGRFIVLEVDQAPARHWKYWMSVIADYVLYPLQEKANYRPAAAFLDLFRRAGLAPETVRPLWSPLVAPILYVGRRVETEAVQHTLPEART